MNRNALLTNLLQPLLAEWSYAEVVDALEALRSHGSNDYHSTRKEHRPKKQPQSKLSAFQQAEKIDAPHDHKKLLLDIAKRFDEKQFLPNIGDVRYFLEMRGRDASGIKQRQDSFRRVLSLLLDTPDEMLNEIIDKKMYSGPSDLRPLAEAIRLAGKDLREKARGKG